MVNTPFPVSTGKRLRLWGVEQHKEPETTFWKFSEHLTHNIWRSTKPRALLECAMFPKQVYETPTGDGRTAWDMLCRPEDLTEVATELGWETGLQRLQSVATEIRNHWQYETLNLHLERFCRMLPEQPKKWTHLKVPPIFTIRTNRVRRLREPRLVADPPRCPDREFPVVRPAFDDWYWAAVDKTMSHVVHAVADLSGNNVVFKGGSHLRLCIVDLKTFGPLPPFRRTWIFEWEGAESAFWDMFRKGTGGRC